MDYGLGRGNDPNDLNAKVKKQSLTASKRQTLISSIASHLLERYPDVMTAYIFGSFVTATAFGDIDVAILTLSRPEKPLNLELSLELELEDIAGCPIDVRVLNLAPLPFRYSVIQEGIVIVDRKPNLRADFEGITLRLYFDFKRFRVRYLKEATHAPI